MAVQGWRYKGFAGKYRTEEVIRLKADKTHHFARSRSKRTFDDVVVVDAWRVGSQRPRRRVRIDVTLYFLVKDQWQTGQAQHQ